MSEKSEASVIGSLPRTRPQRRSDKRAERPNPEQPAGAPAATRQAVDGVKPAAKPRATTPRKAATPRAAATPKAATPKAGAPKAGAPKAATPKAATPGATATPNAGTAPGPQAATPPPEAERGCPSSLPEGAELLGTVVKAAAELAEIGLTVGARALRTAVSRLPRP